MPLGLAFQMSMNEKALENFAKLTDAQKRQVLEAARSVTSKDEKYCGGFIKYEWIKEGSIAPLFIRDVPVKLFRV